MNELIINLRFTGALPIYEKNSFCAFETFGDIMLPMIEETNRNDNVI